MTLTQKIQHLENFDAELKNKYKKGILFMSPYNHRRLTKHGDLYKMFVKSDIKVL